MGDGEACVPVSAKPVVLWSKEAESQPCVVWHVAQFVGAKAGPDVECTGVVVCCHLVKWHPELPQSVGVIVKVKLLLMWQSVQATTFPAGAIWCEFVSGKPVVL